MHRAFYTKPDHRGLWLYSRKPIAAIEPESILSPGDGAISRAAHLRWHPLRGEWVIYAAHRQDRTFMPGPESNPLARSADPQRPTELPVGQYDVAVFENRFPSLVSDPEPPSPISGVRVARAEGRCEVVVYSPSPETSLGQLSTDQIALILEVLADRTREMAALGLNYVLPFENRGAEMGVTLHHPHAQIYGYAFVPAEIVRTAKVLRSHFEKHGEDLVARLAETECAAKTRVVAQTDLAVAFVPPFARFPYENWIVPLRAGADLTNLTRAEGCDMAALLREVLQRLDKLWDIRMPYLMSLNQAPSDGEAHPYWTLRIEIWPTRRARDKLKFLAGTELAAGVFTCDVMPETAAAELRALSP